jgi:light-regulated signal transduction histidine kinase (bacteriophytochrome)
MKLLPNKPAMRTVVRGPERVALMRDCVRPLPRSLPDFRPAASDAALEMSVQARTREIRLAMEELESFSESVSHDLRAPLRAIRGFASILIEEHGATMQPEARNLVGRMSSAAGRIDALAEGLLALAKSGRARVRRSETNLSDVAAAVVAELRESQPAREVIVAIQQDMVAHADPVLMRDVLQNLLGNAWKYSSKNPRASITFVCRGFDDELVYAVSDNGAGFDMAHAGKLFQSFERVHTVSEFEGTGLGLVTVRRILERHGGRIWVEAQPGRGATFFFTLGDQIVPQPQGQYRND